jgi:hypothetical protein
MKTEPKKYRIASFDQLLNVVNEENLERISIDFALWLSTNVAIMNEIRTKHPKETEGKLNSELVKSVFVWIDDGEHDLKSVTITDSRTGEMHEKTL